MFAEWFCPISRFSAVSVVQYVLEVPYSTSLLHVRQPPVAPGASTAQQLERAAKGELHPTRHSRVRGMLLLRDNLRTPSMAASVSVYPCFEHVHLARL